MAVMNNPIAPVWPGLTVMAKLDGGSSLLKGKFKIARVMLDADQTWKMQLVGLYISYENWYPVNDFVVTTPEEVKSPVA